MSAAALLFSASLAPLFAAASTRPLFVIERSKNINVLHYDANLSPGGKLDPLEPVAAYWIMRAEKGQREDLTWLEKKKAYGFDIEPERDRSGFRMILKPVPDRPIRITQEGEEVRAEVRIAGKTARLERIYIRSDETRTLPKVLHIELFGKDAATGDPLYEKIIPKD
jgi:hypothetical protein